MMDYVGSDSVFVFNEAEFSIISLAEYDGDSISLVNIIAYVYNGIFFRQVTDDREIKLLINKMYDRNKGNLLPRKTSFGNRKI